VATRDYGVHQVTSTAISSGKVGDEYYNPTTNKLYKYVAHNGTSPAYAETLTADALGNIGFSKTAAYKLDVAGTVNATAMRAGVFLTGQYIDSNISISSGSNGLSVGPLTLAAGVTLTVTPGQRHIIL
jgi:hypothetical protein